MQYKTLFHKYTSFKDYGFKKYQIKMKRKHTIGYLHEKLNKEEEEMLKAAFGLNQFLLLDLTNREKIKMFNLLKWLSRNVKIDN